METFTAGTGSAMRKTERGAKRLPTLVAVSGMVMLPVVKSGMKATGRTAESRGKVNVANTRRKSTVV